MNESFDEELQAHVAEEIRVEYKKRGANYSIHWESAGRREDVLKKNCPPVICKHYYSAINTRIVKYRLSIEI